MRTRIRDVGVLSALKLGFAVGMVVSVFPVLLTILVVAFDVLQSLKKALTDPWIGILMFIGGVALAGFFCAGLAALAAFAYNTFSAWFGGLDVVLSKAPAEAGTAPHPAGAASTPSPQAAPQVQPQTLSVGGGPSPMPPALAPSSAMAQQPPAYAPAMAPQPAAPPTYPAMNAPPAQAPLSASAPASQYPSGVSLAPQPPPGVPLTSQPVPAAAPAPSSIGPYLALASNPSQLWLVNKPAFFIGSASGSDLYVGGLASQHARIELDQVNRVHVLYDLSGGQTWVNERPVQGRNMLKDNFRVRVGQVDLVFHT